MSPCTSTPHSARTSPPRLQCPLADNATRHADVFARDNRATRSQAAAGADRPPRLDHTRDVNVAAHVDSACKDNGFCLQRIHCQHSAGRAKLPQQPACVVNAARIDQGVQHVLVATALLHIAAEPAKALGARAFGPQKFGGEFHRLTLLHSTGHALHPQVHRQLGHEQPSQDNVTTGRTKRVDGHGASPEKERPGTRL